MAAYVNHMDEQPMGSHSVAPVRNRKRTLAGDPSWRRKVSERAHTIWEREGRPYGRAGDHWLRAEGELLAEERPSDN